ncbi:MAG: hypothetical protein JXJ04_08835 [Spirochaetales bacterium]|nr:hypothetical protein [Spirochaetales bacterium]
MFYNWELADRLSCTPEEMKESYKIVKQIINFSEKSRRMGLLSLENDIDELESKFFQKALRLVVDGTDPALISHILEIQIFSQGYCGKELLENCIIYEGVLAIQQGDNPRIVAEILHSFFPDVFKIEQEKRESEKYQKTMEKFAHNTSDDIYSEFEELFLQIDDRGIQRILREIDTYCLCTAMVNLADPVKYKILKNMSEPAGIMILEDMEFMGQLSEIESKEAQDRIIRIIQKLEDQGEVIVMRPLQ